MPLTIEKAALVKQLAMQDYRDDQIAGLLRISRATVREVTRRAERDAAVRAEWARGKTIRQLAAEFHMAISTVKHIVR